MRVFCLRALALVLVPLLCPYSADASGDAPGQKPTVFAYCETGHVTLDPSLYGKDSADPAHDERLLVALLEPLTVIDPVTREVKPGAASKWSSSSDGRTWTFELRSGAVWQDGTPVTGADFINCWRRTLDPFQESPWSGLFRPLKGCEDISENARMSSALGDLIGKLKALTKQNPTGIPGEELNAELDALGTRPFLGTLKGRAVRRMLKWDDEEVYSPENSKNALKALRSARRKARRAFEDALEAFGTEAGGVYAKQTKVGKGPDGKDLIQHTIVIETNGAHPYLPELMARGAFSPMHPAYDDHRDKLFLRQQYFMANGPYLLAGRGPKPPEGLDKVVRSLVHLKVNPKYDGPNKALMPEIYCYTDQGVQDEVRMFADGAAQFVRMTWKEYPRKGNPKKPETNQRKKIEDMKGFQVRPSTRVAYLRFRCDRPPFDDKNARIAFARSIDRHKLATEAFWPAATPIERLVPPGVRGRAEDFAVPGENVKAAVAAHKASGMDDDTWIEVSYADVPGHLEAASKLIGIWRKTIGMAPSHRLEDKSKLLQTRRSGRYNVMLTEDRGFANDPYAFLIGFHSADPDGGLGWHDKVLDKLLDAARDPEAALSDKAGWLADVKIPALTGPANAGASAFRLACLAEAERRLVSEFVVVPLVVINECELHSGFSGLTSDDARRFPGFVGALHTVKK